MFFSLFYIGFRCGAWLSMVARLHTYFIFSFQPKCFIPHKIGLVPDENTINSTLHKVSGTDQTGPDDSLQCVALGSDTLWFVYLLFLFLLFGLLPAREFEIHFLSLWPTFPGQVPDLIPHSVQVGHFDIEFLIEQPVLNIDLLKNLNFFISKRNVQLRGYLAFFVVRQH